MMREGGRNWSWSFCPRRRSKSYQVNASPFECFCNRQRKKDVLESWPTSPVLYSEEKNAKEKEKAHKWYERQLKASSWYLNPPKKTWIEIVEPGDNTDTCSQCCYDDECGCVLVSNHGNCLTPPKANRESGRSSLGDTLSVTSARASGCSKTSTEDEKSFYDNLCQFCKITSLERRARKYGEWRRRFSAKLAEARAQDDAETKTCTCAMDNLSFIEWKKIYEEKELVKLSRANHLNDQVDGNSDYGTQKSKDSNSTTVYRDYPSLTVKSSSLGYNSLSSIPYTERDIDTDSSYASTDASGSEETEIEMEEVHAGRPHLRPAWSQRMIPDSRDYEDEVFGPDQRGSLKQLKRRRKTRNRNSNLLRTKVHLHKIRPHLRNSEEETTHSEDVQRCSEDVPIDSENPIKIATENDETLPTDFLSEFLAIAKTIDEFYESIHTKKFLENRITATSRDRVDIDTTSHEDVTSQDRTTSRGNMTSRESVLDRTGTEQFSAELRKRIRSLERLCSFVDYSDEEHLETAGGFLENVNELGNDPKEELPIWRLSQQSINLTISRRSRSNTSSDTTGSRRGSNSGSGSSNSRCSTRQSNRSDKQSKPNITSVENLKSPDSGFSDSLTAINSPESCQLGTKWAGSMQWDYSDWEFYYGVGGHEEQLGVSKDRLMTIDEAQPQDPLDWDW